jgi:hypothetical protein
LDYQNSVLLVAVKLIPSPVLAMESLWFPWGRLIPCRKKDLPQVFWLKNFLVFIEKNHLESISFLS